VAARSGLDEYRRKRDPAATPEPFESQAAAGRAPIFVVQRHAARRLHYDFRLERGGALASWAVPKGVPLAPGERALAVHVEDHPLEYARFEGEIPKGQYGAGTVEIWDSGTYELVEEKQGGGLTVRLQGERLRGLWTLVPAQLDGDPKNWLLIRKREAATATVERRAYRPTLATLARDVPTRGDWLYEVKWDGYRALASVSAAGVTLTSRRGNDLAARFPTVVKALPNALRTPSCVLDGEVCALDEHGRASFSAMQTGKAAALVYYVFDLLEAELEPLVDRPLRERRRRLEELVASGPVVRVSESFDDGVALLAAAREQGLEGIVAKRAESRYCEGKRTAEWVKIKTSWNQEFVVAGYTRGRGRRAGRLGSLVLGVNGDEGLEYVGNCGTGFDEDEIDRLVKLLRPLERPTSPFARTPKLPRVRKDEIVWLEPRLVCQVEFAEWTHDGRLRAPVYRGLREDKRPEEVRRELPAARPAASASSPASSDVARRRAEPVPEEVGKGRRVVKLSNLDKPFWPDEGITKGDLLAYYRAVAPALLPHLRGRPFTMKRYPDGWKGKHFFQKDAPKHMPDWIPTVPYHATTRERPPQKRWIQAPLVEDEPALLWMVNMGCIDLNTWYSRVDKPSRPDWVLFDLDPSPDVGFAETIEVALLVREALEALGLESHPKTSGSEGIHVLVPIERRHGYDDTREFAEIVAGALARTHRGLVTTEWSKAKRRGVLIDTNQNGEGKTIASVYSVRPKPGAPVSTPLRWDEVNERLNPSIYTMDVVLARVEREGDLFAGVLKGKQRLGPALRSLRV
jgi:bifunctional non-homologous end joining protein LigD